MRDIRTIIALIVIPLQLYIYIYIAQIYFIDIKIPYFYVVYSLGKLNSPAVNDNVVFLTFCKIFVILR